MHKYSILSNPVFFVVNRKGKSTDRHQMSTLKGQVNYLFLLASWGYSADIHLEQGLSTSFALKPRRAQLFHRPVFKGQSIPLVLLYVLCTCIFKSLSRANNFKSKWWICPTEAGHLLRTPDLKHTAECREPSAYRTGTRWVISKSPEDTRCR